MPQGEPCCPWTRCPLSASPLLAESSTDDSSRRALRSRWVSPRPGSRARVVQFYFRSHSDLLRRWGNIQWALTTTHGCCATPLSKRSFQDRSSGRFEGSGITSEVRRALVVASSGTTEITMRKEATKKPAKGDLCTKGFLTQRYATIRYFLPFVRVAISAGTPKSNITINERNRLGRFICSFESSVPQPTFGPSPNLTARYSTNQASLKNSNQLAKISYVDAGMTYASTFSNAL
jgi:hypothetical protein